jgi:hypothetical protein
MELAERGALSGELPMNRTIQLEIPEEVYASLVEAAEKAGQQPEAMAVKWLAEAAQRGDLYDPLEQFIGAFASPPEASDWATNHDRYLGRNLHGDLIQKTDSGDA